MDNVTKNFDFKVTDGEVTITRYHGNDTDVVIPSEIDGLPVTSIEDWAFSSRSALKNISIPNGVKSIGNDAFHGCESLTSVIIPDSVVRIGEGTFYYCISLTSVIIPDSVTSISLEAFCDCKSLTSVEIPNSVTSIGDRAFGYYFTNGYRNIDRFTIKGTKGSEAERYAKDNEFKFVERSDNND